MRCSGGWLSQLACQPKRMQPLGSPDNQVFVSAASAWELATKVRLGKLEIAATLLFRSAGGSGAARDLNCCRFSSSHGLIAGGYPNSPIATPLIACWLRRLNWKASPS